MSTNFLHTVRNMSSKIKIKSSFVCLSSRNCRKCLVISGFIFVAWQLVETGRPLIIVFYYCCTTKKKNSHMHAFSFNYVCNYTRTRQKEKRSCLVHVVYISAQETIAHINCSVFFWRNFPRSLICIGKEGEKMECS